MDRKTGVVVPLAALYTKDCPDIGDFYALRDFADFCARSNLSVLQLLPVNDTASQSSPYSALSSCALHPVYIRISSITGFDDALKNNRTFSAAYKAYLKKAKYRPRFDYGEVCAEKIRLLHLLYDHLEKKMSSGELAEKVGFDGLLYFCRDHGGPWQRDEERRAKLDTETAMALGKIKSPEEIIDLMEDKKLEELCKYIKEEEARKNN